MSGRSEKEIKSNKKMQQKLKDLPEIFSEFYYHMHTSKSYTTVEKYIFYVQEFAKFVGNGKITPSFYKNTKPLTINRYFTQMRNVQKADGEYYRTSDSIMATKWSALNTFFDFLEANDYIPSNPVAKTTRPKVQDNPEIAFLNEEEMNAILENVKNKANERMKNRDLAIISLGLTTGLRVSALVQIDINDVDFDNNIIRVIEKRGKVCTSFFGDNVKQHLIAWLEDRENYFPKVNTNALFLSNMKKRITQDGIRVILKKYSDGIINKNVTPHVMRHSCATNLYEKTGDIYLCASVLNHNNVATTQRYAEMSNAKKKSATAILDSLI